MSTESGQKPTSSPSSLSDQKIQKEIEKLDAEIAKANAETGVARRRFFQHYGFYTACAPVALAVFGIYYSISSGWFDNQRKVIEAHNTLLRYESEQLENRKKEQQQRIDSVEKELVDLRVERQKLLNDGITLSNQISNLQRETGELSKAKELIHAEALRLAGSETNASRYLSELTSLQSQREKESAIVLVMRNALIRRQAAIDDFEQVVSEFSNIRRPTTKQIQNFITDIQIASIQSFARKSVNEYKLDAVLRSTNSSHHAFMTDLLKFTFWTPEEESTNEYYDFNRRKWMTEEEILKPPHWQKTTNHADRELDARLLNKANSDAAQPDSAVTNSPVKK